MGINGLWMILEPATWKESIHQMVLSEGYMKNNANLRGYRVGIDASGWLYKHLFRHGQTKNPELATLFTSVNRIFTMPMIPLFVFDGAARPNVKRGKVVRGNAHWLEEDFKKMLTAFGFSYHVAPGEAEAELAYLNRAGSIDAIWTDDSDAIVFGALHVFRILSDDRETMEATHCTLFNIQNHPKLHLSRDDLIFIALLAGGDYSDGIPGCGIKTAVLITRTGLGRPLINAIRTLPSLEAENFSNNWVHQFQKFLKNTRYRRLCAKLPSNFPDIGIINLYLQPLTSEGRSMPPVVTWSAPDLGKLACFAEDNFTWGHLGGIFEHFSETVFTGFALRELIGATLQQDDQADPFSSHLHLINSTTPIISTRRNYSTCHMLELRVSIPLPEHVIAYIRMSLQGKYNDAEHRARAERWIDKKSRRLRAWVPFAVMQTVYPGAVAPFAPPPQDEPDDGSEIRDVSDVLNLAVAASDMPVVGDILGPVVADNSRISSNVVIDLTGSDEEDEQNPVSLSLSKRYTVIETAPNVLEFFTDSEGEY